MPGTRGLRVLPVSGWSKQEDAVRRPARFLLKILGVMIVALIVAGVVFEQLGRRWDNSRYPQVGRSVDLARIIHE
jgi:hypothetical protein